MTALGFCLCLLAAAAPTAPEATRLAKTQAWDELLLTFSPVKPESLPGKQRAEIGQAFELGCAALLKSEKVLAASLGEKAVAFAANPRAIACEAEAELSNEQRGAAEDALRAGISRFPKQSHLALLLARALLEDHDRAGARAVLASIPPRSLEGREAKDSLRKLATENATEMKASRDAAKLEATIARGKGSNASPSTTSGLSYESGVGPGGIRTRTNGRFAFKYFNAQRDFGQRADYEGHVAHALEVAHDFCEKTLGQARQSQVDVVLYTKEEFAFHFGRGASLMIAGLYSENAIRVNDAADLTEQTQATLVHEYVHAVTDEVVQGNLRKLPTWLNEGIAEYVEWRYLGSEDPPRRVKVALRDAALAHRLPPLESLAKGRLTEGDNPALTYAESAVAVHMLWSRGGPEALLRLYRGVGHSGDFAAALATEYNISVEQLQREVDDEVKRH